MRAAAPPAPTVPLTDEIDAFLSAPVAPAPAPASPPRPAVETIEAPPTEPPTPVVPLIDEIDAFLSAPLAAPAPAPAPPAPPPPPVEAPVVTAPVVGTPAVPSDSVDVAPAVVEMPMPVAQPDVLVPTAPGEALPAEAPPGAPPSGPTRSRWRGLGVAALMVAALVVVFMAFHSSGKGGASPTASRHLPSTTVPANQVTVTTEPPSTTATTTASAAPPASPQPTAEGAATTLVSSWASGDQARALSVATASAVTTLFGAHYQGGLAGDRGCSSGGPPVTCAFGPPGGASPTDPLYSLTVVQAPGGGWYVSAVKILG